MGEVDEKKCKNARLRYLLCGSLALSILSITANAEVTGNKIVSEERGAVQIPLVGYIENPKFSELATQLQKQYLSHISVSDPQRSKAKAIVAYIGPDVVSNGRFVQPNGVHVPSDQLKTLMEKIFPEEGCRVERIFFENKGDYVVLLVDASDQPSPEYIEQCLLLATLTSLGENLDGQQIISSADMRQLLNIIVNGE